MAGSWAELLQRCSPFLGSHSKGGSRSTFLASTKKMRRHVWLVWLHNCKTILIERLMRVCCRHPRTHEMCNIHVSHVCRKAVQGKVWGCLYSRSINYCFLRIRVSSFVSGVTVESRRHRASRQLSTVQRPTYFHWPRILDELQTSVGFGLSSAAAEQRCSLANQWLLQLVKRVAVCVFV